jgi:hypothetical protein
MCRREQDEVAVAEPVRGEPRPERVDRVASVGQRVGVAEVGGQPVGTSNAGPPV